MNKYITALILFFLPAALFAAPAKLFNIKTNRNTQGAEIVLNFNQLPAYHIFRLAHPERLIVDLDHTQRLVSLPQPPFNITEIKTIRSGSPKPHTLRLVFDLTGVQRFQTIVEQQKIKIQLFSYSPSVSKFAIRQTVIIPPVKPIIVVIDPGHGGKDPVLSVLVVSKKNM